MMQDVYDDLTPTYEVDDLNDGDVDCRDGPVQRISNSNHLKAKDELDAFELFKLYKYIPKIRFTRSLSRTDEDGTLFEVGYGSVVEARGKDLTSNKNLADYLDKKGRMKLVPFFYDHKDRFLSLSIIIQAEASQK
eukprot:scaffold20280_cov78-Cyclotella_meneghiniana.AAC.3